MMRKFVQQAFENEYLSSEAEVKIRNLFDKNCPLDDIDALIDLQQAVNYGYVKREYRSNQNSRHDILVSNS